MNLEEKIGIVKAILKDKKVAIGFSGGADSTLLAYLSSKVSKDTLAITIDNHLFPKGFIEHTQKSCELFGIKQQIIDLNFYDYDNILENSPERCYSCRQLMYNHIHQSATDNGFDFICDGNNISDLVVDRPGILITYENEFKTPFIEAKLTSKEIHEYLNIHDIPYSKSTTCLATRIPTDTRTTKEKISRIRYCEDYILSDTNCKIVKVRDLGKIGICEVDNLNEIFKDNKFKQINDELKQQGFEKVALNLEEINDNEYISIDYCQGSFSYQLPFTINLENTENILAGEIISKNEHEIEIDNIKISDTGLISGHGLENYNAALDKFMETLPKLRRNV